MWIGQMRFPERFRIRWVLWTDAEKALVPDVGPAADPSLVTEYPMSGVCVPKRSFPDRHHKTFLTRYFLLLNTGEP